MAKLRMFPVGLMRSYDFSFLPAFWFRAVHAKSDSKAWSRCSLLAVGAVWALGGWGIIFTRMAFREIVRLAVPIRLCATASDLWQRPFHVLL